MKKNSSSSKDAKRSVQGGKMTIGMDLGDRTSRYCELDQEGQVVRDSKVGTTPRAMTETFGGMARCRIAIEVGTHSPWVSRLLESWGHEVIVANARQVKLISQSSRKDDRMDAQTLARLARIDPQLLRPIRHRSEKAQGHLMVIRAREALLHARTSLVNAARGLAKSVGQRLPPCDPDQMSGEHLKELPAKWQETLRPLVEEVESLTKKIKAQDAKIEQIARTEYPETALLRQVSGVGPLIAVSFILTVEDPHRFQKSRDAGCYVGLRPKRSSSGDRDPQLLLHRLWVTGEVYEPLRNSQKTSQRPAA